MSRGAVWWMRCRLPALLLCCGTLRAQMPPPHSLSQGRIRATLDWLRQCEVHAGEAVLSVLEQQSTARDIALLRHAEPLDTDALGWISAADLVRWRTATAAPTVTQVARERCLQESELWQAVLTDLHIGEVFAHGDEAWVSLVTRDLDYFGAGLQFTLEAGHWRFQQVEGLLSAAVRHPRHARLWTVLATPPIGPACQPPVARLPPAPEPQGTEEALEAAWSPILDPLMEGNPANISGYLQRRAFQHYARPGAPSAHLGWAMVQSYSLHFSAAPPPASPAWIARLDQTVHHASLAAAAGLPATAELAYLHAQRATPEGLDENWSALPRLEPPCRCPLDAD